MIGYLLPGKQAGIEALSLIIRTAAIVLLWVLLIAPLWKKYVLKKTQNRKDQLSSQYKGLKKWKEFVLGLIVISLQYDASDK